MSIFKILLFSDKNQQETTLLGKGLLEKESPW